MWQMRWHSAIWALVSGFLGAQHDGRHAFGGLSQVRAGQIGRLADVAGRGPRSRTRAVSAKAITGASASSSVA